MKYIYVIFISIIVFISISLIIKVNLFYDFQQNIGKIKIYLFGIKFIDADISFIGFYFNLIRKNKKVIQIKIKFDKKSIEFFNSLQKLFIKKIYLNRLSCFGIIGLNNCYNSAIFIGCVDMFLGAFYSLLQNRFNDVDLNKLILCNNNNFELKININLGFSITIFDLIWSLFLTIYLRGIYVNKKRIFKK